MRLINSFHFAALGQRLSTWLNELSGIACTVYKPSVAPAGATEPFSEQTPFPLLGQERIQPFSF